MIDRTVSHYRINEKSVATALILPFLAFLTVGPTEKERTTHIDQQPTIHVDVNLVTVAVRVTDHKNHEVRGLKAGDFSVYEDGKSQKISFFSAEDQPISLAILLDKSLSMSLDHKLGEGRKAAMFLVDALHVSNELSYLTFDHEVATVVDLTTDHGRVKSAISETKVGTGGTALYDAIVQGLNHLVHARFPRQALVVITDGADQHSRLRLEGLVHSVQISQAQVYMVGYFNPAEHEALRRRGPTVSLWDGTKIDNPLFVFQRLAKESGAERFFPTSDSDLERAVKAISADLRHQYALSYYPPNPSDTAYRRLRVEVARRGLRVRARHGYRLRSGF